jgi:antitoxin component of RelBE/YafQ-DinJ toxin-antitoxin module
MSTTTLHIQIDKQTKDDAARLAGQLGLDLSVIVKASLKNFLRTQRFEVEQTHRMTPYLEKVLEEARKDIAVGRNISKTFSRPGEIAEYLHGIVKKKKA